MRIPSYKAPRTPLRTAGIKTLVLLCTLATGFVQAADLSTPYLYDAEALADGTPLKSWVLCGPFPNASEIQSDGVDWIHDARCGGLFTDYLADMGGELQAQPQPGQRSVAPDGEARPWAAITAPNDNIYLGDYMSPTTNQVGYAVCWIDSEVADNRLFGVGSSDGIRIWVNGTEVFRFHAGRELHQDDNYFRIPLEVGRNQVMVKVGNGDGRWGFTLRPVENSAVIKALIPKLPEALRFDYEIKEDGFRVTWGDPTVVGNLENLPQGRVDLIDPNGALAGRVEVSLGRPFLVPFAEYGGKKYTLAGQVLWPFRGKVKSEGLLYRGDPREELHGMVAAAQPVIADTRAGDAYTHLLATVSEADARDLYANEPRAYVQLKDGLTRALEAAITLQNSVSPYDHLFPKPRQVGTSTNRDVIVSPLWSLHVADSIFTAPMDEALETRWTSSTSESLSEATGEVYVFALETGRLSTAPPELQSDDSEFADPAAAIRDRVPTEDEGYALSIEPGRIIIAGRTAAGAFYGMDTLLQLLAQTTTLATATIVDAPVYPTRAAVLTLDAFDDDIRAQIDALARLRVNKLFLPSPFYPDLEDSELFPWVTGAYAYCRERFIDPIPLLETFGSHSIAAEIDPNLIEGVQVIEMPVVVDDLRRIHLPYDRILLTETTKPQLRTEKGYKVLRQDRDFTFESFAPPIIQLKGKAPVQTGETLLLTADLVDSSLANNPASCPSDASGWLITESIIEKIYTHLSPTGFHIGQTGTGYLNRDSRCIAREQPNALLLADAVQKSYDIVRKFDKRAEVYMWGDQVSPFQGARALDATRAAEYLPKDITILDWWYKGASEYDAWRIEQGLRFFDQYGLKTLGVVREDPLNIRQFATMNYRFSQRFGGMVHQLGAEAGDGRYLAAEAGWQGATALGDPEPAVAGK